MALSSDAPVIALDRVEKVYRGRVRALRGVSLRVDRGAIFGLLGPNGAGKSTLVKILMTVVRPTACEGRLLGLPVGDKAALARVGYLAENPRFPDYLTGEQALHHFAALAGVHARDRRARIDETLDLVRMRDWRKKKISGYSKGMRQRIGLAQALMNNPELVMLDEPTDGVDPVGRKEIRDIMRTLRDQGRTVVLNSHLLGEVESVCDRVAILVQGTVVKQGSVEELTRESRRYEIETAGAVPDHAAAHVASLGAAVAPSPDPARGLVTVLGDDPRLAQPAIDALRAAGVVIAAVRPVRQSLEDLFMQAVTDPNTGQALLPGAARERRGPAARGARP